MAHLNRKIRLLVLLKNYDGGTGTFVRLWKQYYQDHPSPVIESMRVLSLQKPRLILAKKIVDGFFIEANYSQEYHFIRSIYMLLKELLWLWREIKTYHPDMVLSVDAHAIVLVEIIRMVSANRFVSIHTIHNNIERVFQYRLSQPYKQWIVKNLLTYLLNRSKQVVCISKELSLSVKQFLKLHRIPSTIYYGIEQNKKKSTSQHQKVKTILSIGRFDDQKDFDTLLNAFQRVYSNNEYRLVIVGDGPKRSHLQDLIHNLKLDEVVKIVPWQKDLSSYFKNADMFVLSSNWEGLSFVILEAMSYYLPIISSDCDFGPREILRYGQDGILFPVGEVNSLADCIESISDKSDIYANRSRQRVKSFSMKQHVLAYEELLQKVTEIR